MFDGFALLQMCPARIADGGRSRKRRKETGAVRETERREPKRQKESWRRKRRARNAPVAYPALVRHAQAVDDLDMQELGFEELPSRLKDRSRPARPSRRRAPGSHDTEAADKENPELAQEAVSGKLGRVIRALQLETELRINPGRRADRFVDDWQKLDQASLRRYQAGDISGYRSARSAMGDMARSLERDPQLQNRSSPTASESSASRSN